MTDALGQNSGSSLPDVGDFAPASETFLRNAWYAVAWSHEVHSGPFEIEVCGRKIVLLRTREEGLSAISGICPHRFASLAKGKLIGGNRLQCPYHGLEFGPDGRCVTNPHGPIPGVLRLERFCVEERHSIIWLWYGDRMAADTSLIPDFQLLEDERHHVIYGRLLTRAHFELISDNLMDLSHVGFVHDGGIGDAGAISKGEHSVSNEGTTLRSNRWCPNSPAPPVWSMLFGGYKKPVDHWLNMRWDAPSTMWLDVGVTPTGKDRSEGITVWGAHLLAPRNESETHYLWAACRDFALGDVALDEAIRSSIEHAFIEEDKPIIEDVARNMAGRSFKEMRPLIMPFDEGAIRARRLLDDLRIGRKKQRPSAVRCDSDMPAAGPG